MAKSVQRTRSKSSSAKQSRSASLYKNFVRWTKRSSPPWHPVKKMRYVFWRMIDGSTIVDAIAELSWSSSEFWHLVELGENSPFRIEYLRARRLQGRAFSDSVVTVAEGRDRITALHQQRIDRIIAKATHRLAKNKSVFKAKAILQHLMADLREHDKVIITRNRLQMDASKWIAETANPNEFGKTSKLSLGAPIGEGDTEQKPIQIQFIGPDGKVVGL